MRQPFSTARQRGIGAVAALDDPLRLRLLSLVRASDRPLSRDAAAAAIEVPRSTAAFHLDRLVEAGLLVVDFQRASGKTGPGSGRPAKMYAAAQGEIDVTVPERHYDLMGDLLATALEQADGAVSALDALRDASSTAGAEAGAAATSIGELLDQTGYEPAAGPDGVTLTNCPFHRLAQKHTQIVCTANHAFLCAAAAALGEDPNKVILAPQPGGCCVRIKT